MTLKLRRYLMIGGGLVFALLVLALVIPLLVDINRYHDTLEAQAAKLLGRDVTLGTLRLTLFPLPGVSVKPVAIASDRKGDPPLLRAESLAAHARLLPLLGGKVAVASLVAHQPVLNLHRYPDGHFNLPNLNAAAEGGTAAPSGSKAEGSGLSLAKLRIRGATLRLVDEAVLPGKTVTTTLNGVNIALDDYAPDRPFGLKLAMDLPPRNSGSLDLEGTIALPPALPGPAPGETNVDLKLKKFQPAAFAPYIQSLAGVAPPLGSASGRIQARGRLKTGTQGTWELEGDGVLKGTLELRGVALRAATRGASPTHAGDLDLTLDLSIKEGGRRLEIRNLAAGTGKTRLAASGSLQRGDQSSRIDVQIRPSQVMAADLATVAALVGAKFPAGFTSSAPIVFQGSASGPLDHPEQLKFDGAISLSGVRYADPTLGKPIEEVSGKLTFQNGAFKVSQFAARVGETRVQGGLAVRDFTSPQVTLDLSSPKANLGDLMGLLTPTSPTGAPAPAATSGNDVLARTRGTGTIRIGEGSFGTFRFTHFTGNLRLAEKVVTFDPVSFQLYGGSYQGSLSADLRQTPTRYSYRSNLKGVDAQPFLAENFGIKDLLAGSVSAQVEMEGSGSEMNSILSSLKGQGSLKVDKGWIGQLNVMQGLAKASNVLGERTLAKVSSQMAKKRTDFTSLTGNIALSGGRATSNNLKLVSKDLDLEGKGGFTLQGILDLDLKVLFSKEMTEAMLQEGSRARYLDREGDRLVLPLTIKGPLASPTYGVNLDSIVRAAAKSGALDRLAKSNSPLAQLAGSLLGGRSGSRKEPAAPSQAAGSHPPPGAPTATVPVPSTGGAIVISSSKYEGGLLFPDLTLRGEFGGVGLSGADLRVEGKGGNAILEKTNAFKEIAAYYATHDPNAPARIPFKMKIDGKRLAGAGDLKITITLHRTDGTFSVQTFSEKKPGL
ncbi:MAG: hypothetical protein DMH00_04650 [Acidobacteria bacterium]|nr:MAG: hypothetical protein DMH00_04650 [Acidobacteriota bacterium]